MSPRQRSRQSSMLLDPSLRPSRRKRLARWWSLQVAPFWRVWYRTNRWVRRAMVTVVAAVPVLLLRDVVIDFRQQWSSRTNPGQILLGRNAPLGGALLFPEDNHWNLRIDGRPVSPLSERQISAIGEDVPLHPDFGSNRVGTRVYGIPYVVVDGFELVPSAPVFHFPEESDEGLYPIPDDPPIESGGDRHLLILDTDENRLYELYLAEKRGGTWTAASGAIFDLNSSASRPRGWTSADAAGLPILPGLVRADEVYDIGEIRHALRFTLPSTRQEFVYPARHFASRIGDEELLPMGARLRLRADYDLSDFPPGARVIAEALKRYGMILADNGSALYLTGTADRRWKRKDVDALKRIRAIDFEVIVPPPPPASDTTIRRELEEGLPGFSAQ
jgi:hypothetical protein